MVLEGQREGPISNARLRVHLDSMFPACNPTFALLAGFHGTVHNTVKNAKRAYQCIFRFHGTIHIFKNYFTTVFSAISFQFSINKRYPNTHSSTSTAQQSYTSAAGMYLILLQKTRLIAPKILRMKEGYLPIDKNLRKTCKFHYSVLVHYLILRRLLATKA